MNVLFLNDSYWNNANSITFCIDDVISHFQSDDKAFVLCLKNHADEPDKEIINNVTVYRTSEKRTLNFVRSAPCKKDGKFKRQFKRAVRKVLSGYGFDWAEGVRNAQSKKVNLDNALKIIKENDIKAVVSCSAPFSSHVLAAKIKEKLPDVKIIAYQLDPFAYHYRLTLKGRTRRARLESRVLGSFDKIVQLSCIYNFNSEIGYLSDLREKTVSVTLPGLFIDGIDSCADKNGDKFIGIYTGEVYDMKIVDMLSAIAENDIRSDFYGKRSEKIDADSVKGHGFVSNKERDRAFENCDFFILQGDRDRTQVPSKCINYIRTGKPILHVKLCENDSCMEYLEHYGNYLTVPLCSNPDGELKEKIRCFIKNSRNNRLSNEELRSRLIDYLDDNVSGKIYRIIKEISE